MIPKIIHYCWFGNTVKSDEIIRCIESWKIACPDFEVKEWNELNFTVEEFRFASKMYNEKKWAFVADYTRLYVLEKEGGFYLDTDMLLLKNLDPLTKNDCVLGEEENGIISAGMIASIPNHPFIINARKYYDDPSDELITIPRVLSKVYNDYAEKTAIVVLPSIAFYPFTSQNIKNYRGQDLGPGTYGVHLWHYSWGHPLNKFFKNIGIYNLGKKITEILGIKKLIKKLFGFV